MNQEINPILLQQKNLNPYRNAVGRMVNRLLWDLNLQSWVSRKKLKKIYESNKGKKAVILCNGPSLLKVDLTLLEDVYTFGLNKINLLFDKTNFRPNAIVAVNELVIEQNKDFFNSTNIPLFIDSKGIKNISPKDNVTYLHADAQVKFSRDVSLSLWQGNTVTTVALQIAFHMGFEKVALVGCDHNFGVSGPANKTVKSEEVDISHFDPNYFSKGVKWQLPDLVTSEYGYYLARETFDAEGRELYNCTEGGNLEILERKSLIDFIKN